MTTLHIHLCGQLRLFWQERPFPFKALPKVEPLLAYLLLNQDTPTVRDTLAFKLWPDATEKQAKGRLRRHLYDLRRALPDETGEQPWLLITAQTVQWNPAAPYWLDVAAFEHLSHQPNRLAEAIALYTGAMLPDMDEAWLLPVRQRLQTIYQQLLSQLVEQSWQAQDYRQALRYCKQILVEDAFNEAVLRQRLALHYALGDRGTAVTYYHYFVQQLGQELEVEPLPETTAVYTAIQQNQPSAHLFALVGFSHPHSPAPNLQSPVPHNIPTSLRSLIGRQAEQAQIILLVANEPPQRLLTLTGTGGIGKTRLAIAVGQALVESYGQRFPDGIFFVSLAPLREAEQVITAVAETLSLSTNNNPLEAVREHLRYQQCLLILDNFEHLLPAITQLHDLLQTAPQLQLLVTSRTPLNLYGEQEYPVPALELPLVTSQWPMANDQFSHDVVPQERIVHLQTIESIAFFTAVARTVNPRFELTAQNGTAVAQICQKLDGLPLAIELAAARSKHFPPDVLLQQLTKSLNILESQAQDVPERHRTIEAALQWSFDLLSAAEQQLLVGLSVFEDGFSVTAVSFTLLNKPFTDITHLDPETITLLTSLADKNLIYPASHNRVAGELRFTMLTVVRSFVRQKLAASEAAALQTRLLQYFGQWYEPLWDTFGKPEEATWTHHFQVEYKNLMSVLAYGRAQSASSAEIIAAMARIACFHKKWQASGHIQTALDIAAWVLDQETPLPPKLLQHLHFSAAGFAAANGDYALALVHTDACQGYAQQRQDYAAVVTALELASTMHNRQEEPEKALAVLRQAEAILDDADKEVTRRDYCRAGVQGNIGITYYFLGNYTEAERFLLLQLEYDVAQADLPNVGHGAVNLGAVAMIVAAYDKAEGYFRQSLIARQQAREWWGVMQCVASFADLAFARGQWHRCVMLNGAAMRWNEQQGYQVAPFALRERQEKLEQCQTELGEQVYQTAVHNGRNLTLEQAAALALQEIK